MRNLIAILLTAAAIVGATPGPGWGAVLSAAAPLAGN